MRKLSRGLQYDAMKELGKVLPGVDLIPAKYMHSDGVCWCFPFFDLFLGSGQSVGIR